MLQFLKQIYLKAHIFLELYGVQIEFIPYLEHKLCVIKAKIITLIITTIVMTL